MQLPFPSIQNKYDGRRQRRKRWGCPYEGGRRSSAGRTPQYFGRHVGEAGRGNLNISILSFLRLLKVIFQLKQERAKQQREKAADLRQKAADLQRQASAIEKVAVATEDAGGVRGEEQKSPKAKATPRSRKWRRDRPGCKPYAPPKGPRRGGRGGGRGGIGGGSFATIQIGSGRPIVYMQK